MAKHTPSIQSSASTPGTRQGDRSDLVASQAVTLVDLNSNNTGGSRLWSILWQPPGSNISITNPTSNSATYTPVVPGTYTIECKYTVGGNTWRFYNYLSVPYPESGIRMPAAGEGGADSRSFDDGGDDDYGWWGAMNRIAFKLEEIIAGGTGTLVSDDDTTSGTLEEKIVGSGDIVITTLNPGGNEQLQIAVDLSSIESDISALDGRLDTAESDITSLEGDVSTLDGRLDTAESDITALDGRLDTAESDIDSLQASFTTIDTSYVNQVTKPPSSPSAYDEEFTLATAANLSNWTLSPAKSASAIDAYATITTNPRISWGGLRESWLTFQPADATDCYMFRAATLDTNCSLVMRAAITHHQATIGAAIQSAISVGFSEDGTLNNHHVAMDLVAVPSSGHVANFRAKHTAGTTGSIGTTTPGITTTPYPYDLVGIQKISGNYHGFVGNSWGGNWVRLGTSAFAYSGNTLDTIMIRVYNDGGLPGTCLGMIDYVRYKSGINLPYI